MPVLRKAQLSIQVFADEQPGHRDVACDVDERRPHVERGERRKQQSDRCGGEKEHRPEPGQAPRVADQFGRQLAALAARERRDARLAPGASVTAKNTPNATLSAAGGMNRSSGGAKANRARPRRRSASHATRTRGLRDAIDRANATIIATTAVIAGIHSGCPASIAPCDSSGQANPAAAATADARPATRETKSVAVPRYARRGCAARRRSARCPDRRNAARIRSAA